MLKYAACSSPVGSRVGELRDLHQPRLDRVGQPEVADDPREDPVRVLAGAREVVRRRGEVDAEVDAGGCLWIRSSPSIQTVDSCANSSARSSSSRSASSLAVLGVCLPDPVGVVGLVVEDEDVLLAADLAAEQALHELRVALDVARLLDDDLLLLRAAGPRGSASPWSERELERLLGHVAARRARRSSSRRS